MGDLQGMDFQDSPVDVELPADMPSWQQGDTFYNQDVPADDIYESNPADLPKEQEIGNPEKLGEYWRYQGINNDCALFAQGGVLEAEGQEFDIEHYRSEGLEEGWYDPQLGTYVVNFGDLMEDHGIPVNRYDNASMEDLSSALDAGKGIITAVDCLPIWGEPGGHALWVTGMEVDAQGVPTQVICNNSGREDGQGIAYPADDFLQAWSMYGNHMVTTQDRILALS